MQQPASTSDMITSPPTRYLNSSIETAPATPVALESLLSTLWWLLTKLNASFMLNLSPAQHFTMQFVRTIAVANTKPMRCSQFAQDGGLNPPRVKLFLLLHSGIMHLS